MSSLTKKLEVTLLSSFPKSKRIVVINADATLSDAVKILQDEEVMSAPVRDPKQPDDAPWSVKYLGVIDIHTILNAMLDSLDKANHESDFRKQLLANVSLATQRVIDHLSLPISEELAPFCALYEDSNLLDVTLLLGRHRIPRIYVVQRDGDIVNVLTQTAVARQLLEIQGLSIDSHVSSGGAGGLFGLTLEAVGLAGRVPCPTLTISNAAIDGFRILKSHNIDSIPIVNDNGAILSDLNIKSAKHLVLNLDAFKFLHAPFSSFSERLQPVGLVTSSTTLAEVLHIVLKQRIHAVYVVNQEGILQRVVPLSDVLSVFVKNVDDYIPTSPTS